MGLLDIDAEEPDPVLEFIMDLVETPGLLAERRSGVAAEHQRHRVAQHRRQPERLAGARCIGGENLDLEIGRLGADPGTAFSRSIMFA